MSPVARRRQPMSPGEILREGLLAPLGMTEEQLADRLGCDVKVVNRIIDGRAAVSIEMALKLGPPSHAERGRAPPRRSCGVGGGFCLAWRIFS